MTEGGGEMEAVVVIPLSRKKEDTATYLLKKRGRKKSGPRRDII